MKAGHNGIKLMHYFEQCRLKAYPDPATGGKPWTIGWGDTGPDVLPGLVITRAEADARFARRLVREFEPGVLDVVQRNPEQCQFDAFVSLAYNIGLANFRSSSALRKFNLGDLDGAAQAITLWNKAAGRVMKGLQRRREAERLVFQGARADDAIALALAKFP